MNTPIAERMKNWLDHSAAHPECHCDTEVGYVCPWCVDFDIIADAMKEIGRLSGDVSQVQKDYAGLDEYCGNVCKSLESWMNDKRACMAVASDCEGNEEDKCPCLYCTSRRILGGQP